MGGGVFDFISVSFVTDWGVWRKGLGHGVEIIHFSYVSCILFLFSLCVAFMQNETYEGLFTFSKEEKKSRK